MWIFSLICWIASSSFVMSGEPPKILNEYRSLIQAKMMDRVQLTCPVQQQSKDLLFSWMKDNESISISWVRLETKGAHLIIDDVEPEDSGKYVCIATNGFGSQRADILLIVTDPLTESTTTDPTAEFESSNDLLIQGLSFTEETLRQPRQVRITAGSSLDIQCGVAGYPHPDLIWLKDGVLYQRWQQNQPDETGWKVSHLTLSIRRASSGSSGNYTCLALGLKEKIQTTFIIKVLLGSELPDLSQVQPSNNVTERRGGKAKFLCWVYSSSEPEVEWFKRLPSNEIHNKELNSNTSLVVGEDQYQKLDQLEEELVRKADGSYLKKLLLDPLDEQDKGLYLCLGVNRYGYNIQKTYLYIQPNYDTSNSTKSVPFSIMVALPSVLILSIAGGFVCWVREREKERRQAVLAALDTGWSHAYVERQQQQQQQAIESIGQQTGHTRQTLTSGTGSHLLNEQADVDLIIGKRTDDVQQQSNYYFERHQLDQQRNTSDFKPSMIH